MAYVRFFEKPGCITNGRQKQMLIEAGHQIEVRNLLGENWTADRLSAFFGDMPVSQWFNRASPRIKSGEVNPAALDAEVAMLLLRDDPLLIRRPLMESGEWRCAGFDAVAVDRAIGLKLERETDEKPLEGCAHGETGRVCASPA